MTNPARSRGMRDLLPADMRAFRRAEDAFRSAAVRWGYSEVRTPTIEPYSLFTAAGALTPQMLSRVYSFLDWDGWSGERVVLRPDSTIPVTRAAAESDVDLPARLVYVQNVFRFNEDDADREEWQFGLEYLDAPSVLGDVEVILVASEALSDLGLDPVVRLSHSGILRAIVQTLAAGDASQAQQLLDRAVADGIASIAPEAAAFPAVQPFLDLAARGAAGAALAGNLRALATSALPAAVPALDNLIAVSSALADAGEGVEIVPGMAGDFEYYTGTIFEFVAGTEEVGVGGRYRASGSSTEACGLALDADKLAATVRRSTREPLVVAIIPSSPSHVARALSIARELHLSGIAASLGTGSAGNRLAVRVGETLEVDGPDGTEPITALGDLVGLLLRYK